MTGFLKRNAARVFLGLRQILALLACGVAILGVLAAAAVAEDLSPGARAQLSAKRQALFDEMLRHPANLDAAFAYADISARLGDNEAAVSALERMLLFNPNLTRVDLELGALYFRMGSYATARIYFDKALAANPPPAIRSRIDEYRRRIALEESPHHVTGYFLHGFQYQSDANVAPGSPLIHSPIGDVLLNSQFVKRDDANLFAAGALLYTYDLGTQDRDTLEIGGTGYINKYLNVGRLDLAFGEVTIGPRLNFPELAPGVTAGSVKPYLIFNEVGLGLDQYFFTYGGGVEATAIFDGGLRLRAAFEFRQKSFSDAPDRPLSRGLNGNDKLVAIELDKSITDNSVLTLQFDFLDQRTRFDFYSNKAYAGTVAYRIRYDDPTGWLHLPWQTGLFLSRTWQNYAAPDPCCNTSGSPFFFFPSDRFDRRWRFGISQSIEVAADTSIILQVQRDIVSSNLPLYAYTSNSVLIGPQIRF